MSPAALLLDRADFDELPAWQPEDAAPALSVVPRRSLRDYLSGVDLIVEALEQLDADALADERRDELSADLISALAGTRAKVDAVGRVLAMFEGLEAAAAAEIDRLAARQKRFARQRERLQDYVIATMTASSLAQLDGETTTLRLRANPPAVVIDDAGAIPQQFLRHRPAPPPEPDKTAIKAALRSRAEIPGARLVQTSRLVRS